MTQDTVSCEDLALHFSVRMAFVGLGKHQEYIFLREAMNSILKVVATAAMYVLSQGLTSLSLMLVVTILPERSAIAKIMYKSVCCCYR